LKEGDKLTLSDQRKEYLYDYQKSKLKRIPLDVQKEKYEEIKAAADHAGESVNGYIKKAIDERMERDSE
jgi:predicted HicB family RNase H-like nuclease